MLKKFFSRHRKIWEALTLNAPVATGVFLHAGNNLPPLTNFYSFVPVVLNEDISRNVASFSFLICWKTLALFAVLFSVGYSYSNKEATSELDKEATSELDQELICELDQELICVARCSPANFDEAPVNTLA